ncbi:MAG: aminopeptidase P family protein [Theionarchaea archaeon]|nr:aminopeptidase P family protein [Theionarchaea archaeon]
MRTKRIFEHAPKVDAIVLMNAIEPQVDMSFFYVTGLTSGLFERCAAIVYPNEVEIVVSSLEEESARKGKCEVSVFADKKERESILKEKLKGLKTIGINADEMTYGSYLTLKKVTNADFVDVSTAIKNARLIKDTEEIQRTRKACDIISRVAEEIPDLVQKSMTELELAAELVYSMQKKGATGPAFPTLVCFGKNASEPHHSSGDTHLERGDFVLVDMGASYNRYVSDITRTYIFGEADEKQIDMYETVLESQEIGLNAMKDNVEGKNVYLKVKHFLDEKYRGRFMHGLGHSIGLSVHDGEGMGNDSETILQEGMILTVEPGLYIPGYGGVRIEDDVLIKKNGVELLTDAKKELQVI